MVAAESGRYCYHAFSEILENRDPMDVAGLSPERGARSGAAASISSRDGRGRRPHHSVAESVHLGQGPAPSARPAGDADPAAPDAADHLQADYFVRMLSQSRRLIEQRIDDYRKAIATAQAGGDVDAVCNLRRMARIEEQDRHDVDGMLEKLRRRFARRTPGEVPLSPEARRATG